jgi:hypothetical protein
LKEEPGATWVNGELFEWLFLLYRAEKQAEQFLSKFVRHLDPYPEVKKRMKAYLVDVKTHSSLVLSCIERMRGTEGLPEVDQLDFDAYHRIDRAMVHLLSMTAAQVSMYQWAEGYASVIDEKETARIVVRLAKSKHDFLSFLYSGDAVRGTARYIVRQAEEENSKVVH